MTIKWIRENPGSQPDEGIYYDSADGRFAISPQFRHTIYPSGYTLSDRVNARDYSCDGIRECKARALRLLAKEAAI